MSAFGSPRRVPPIVHVVASILVIAGTLTVLTILTRDDDAATTAPTAPAQPTGSPVAIDTPALQGWNHEGAGGFHVETDGERTIYVTRGGPGALWFARPVEDFEVSFDFRLEDAADDSGMFVRAVDPVAPPSEDAPFEVQISGSGRAKSSTGAIRGLEESFVFFVPAPQVWHHMTIRAVDEKVLIYIEGQLINQFPKETAAQVPATGYFGFENHSADDAVSFRDIRLTELAAP